MPLMLRCYLRERERERGREGDGRREIERGSWDRDLEVGSGVGMEIVNVYSCNGKRVVKSLFIVYLLIARTSRKWSNLQ
jgi:hypothetical protein